MNDPKLPIMDVYVLPKHIWEKYDAKAIKTYDGVRRRRLRTVRPGRDEARAVLVAEGEPELLGGAPAVDEVIFRVFTNADTMVAALKSGEIDVAHDIPNNSVEDLRNTPGIVVVVGQQGGFDELALNGGDGLKKPHPALLDPMFGWRSPTRSTGRRSSTACSSASVPRRRRSARALALPGSPRSPRASRSRSTSTRRTRLLDEGGYKDTDGDGVREMPGGGDPLNFTYLVNTESQAAPEVADFMTGWLKEIGIAVTPKSMDENRLYTEIGNGEYDLFQWGGRRTSTRIPCSRTSSAPTSRRRRIGTYNNDANYCDPEYDKLYKQQNVELDPEKRQALVHEMLTRFYDAASTTRSGTRATSRRTAPTPSKAGSGNPRTSAP